jgi:hypothetical protein
MWEDLAIMFVRARARIAREKMRVETKQERKMTDEREKLPLEYPLKQALEIYFKRLIVFVNVVLLNFALLGLLLGITTFAKEPSSATLIMWGVALLILSLITLRQPFRNMISQHMARLEQITVSPALSAVLIFVGLGLLINLFFSFLSH